MRFSKLLTWLIFSAACACLVGVGRSQQPAPATRMAGRIVVAKVTGTVTATNSADRTSRALATNDVIGQNYVISTAGASSAVLVFSNGATVNVGADSVLSIDEFLQDPFDQAVKVSDLKEEPSTSTTRLNLTRGELVGNVKHLHQDKGSSFTVNTPVGAAGIRGTTFRIVFTPDASGKVTFSLQTADGQVLFTGTTNTQVKVDAGKQITATVEVKVDPTTNTVTVTSQPTITSTETLSAADQVTIQTATQEAVEAAKTVILQSTTKQGSTQSSTPQDTDTTPPATPTSSNTTSLAGKH